MLTSVGVPGAASGKEAVTGTLTAAGQMSQPFEPVIGRPFYVSIWGDAQGENYGATAYLHRSFDRGASWLLVEGGPEQTVYAGLSKSFTSYEAGVLYAVKAGVISGTTTIRYRLSQ